MKLYGDYSSRSVCGLGLATLTLLASPLVSSAFAGPISPSGVSPVSAIVQVAAKKSRPAVRHYYSASTNKRARTNQPSVTSDAPPEAPRLNGYKGGHPDCMTGKGGC